MFRKLLIFIFVLFVSLTVLYKLGPKPNYEKVNTEYKSLNLKITDLEGFILDKEAFTKIKPENNSTIIWANAEKKKTEYSIVYLHGFSASPQEGNPVHVEIAQKFGMNLYLPLLAGHGIESKESFINTSPNDLVKSALEAIAIGKKLGNKVIVMSCSTGSTLANIIAYDNPNLIDAHIMYSPNFGLVKTGAFFSNNNWGLPVLRKMFGSNYRSIPGADEDVKKYWTHTYRLEGIALTVELIEQMYCKKNIAKIEHPVFIGCYFKNEKEQDKIVDIAKMEQYLDWISTDDSKKRFVKFPDVGGHVITNPIFSTDVKSVIKETELFIKNVVLNK